MVDMNGIQNGTIEWDISIAALIYIYFLYNNLYISQMRTMVLVYKNLQNWVINQGQMLINIPYMEYLGYCRLGKSNWSVLFIFNDTTNIYWNSFRYSPRYSWCGPEPAALQPKLPQVLNCLIPRSQQEIHVLIHHIYLSGWWFQPL